MFDAEGRPTRTWMIFFERLNQVVVTGVGDHVIGWDLQDCTVGLDVSDPVIPIAAGSIAACYIRIKVSDPTNPLEIDIRKNGTSIFTTRPLIAAGTTTRNVQTFTGFVSDPLTVAVFDDIVIDIVQGGLWEVAVYLAYDNPE